MVELEVFHFENDKESFENYSRENGYTNWSARKLMECLGYSNWNTFYSTIMKAMGTCNTLDIPVVENFKTIEMVVDGELIQDFKISRFACYLIAMNGDVNLPQVAKAQAYFATIAGALHDYQKDIEGIKRLQGREKISQREASLSSVARRAGVESYALFQNAGYRGMYNKNMSELKAIRQIDPTRSLLDFMGDYEYAANWFRLTQTELKIKNEYIQGQEKLENTAEEVGKQVRSTIINISKIVPEDLPKHEDIRKVKKGLKTKNRALKKIRTKKLKNK